MIESTIQDVCTGYRFCTVQNSLNDELNIILSSPNLSDIMWYEFWYNKFLKQALDSKMMTEIELINNAIKLDLWSSHNDSEINKIKEGIVNLKEAIDPKRGIYKDSPIKIKQTKKRIAKEQNILDDLLKAKSSIISDSTESYANSMSHLYLMPKISRDLENNLIWNFKDFIEFTDLVLLNNILSEYFNKSLDMTTIRDIAKSNEWRFKWSGAQKSHDGLFGRAVSDYSQEQSLLVMWSQIYDSAYESTDRPSNYVIEDDDLFDRWLERQSKQEKRPERPIKHGAMRDSFVFTEDDSASVEEIYRSNPMNVQNRIEQENERILKEGSVSEFDLRHKLYQLNLEKEK